MSIITCLARARHVFMFFENYLCNSFETFDVNAFLLEMEMTAVMLFLNSRSDNTRQISMKH